MKLFCKRLRRALCFALAFACIMGAVPMTAGAESFLAVVTSDSMRVYKNASLTSAWGILSKLDVVEVLAYNGGVARIKKGTNIGYARISDMQRADALAEEAVINRDCSVFVSPNENAKSISVKNNLQVNLLGVDDEWALLERNGMIAYCKKEYITLVNQQESAAGSEVVHETFDAVVSVSSARVYSSASEASRFLGLVHKNTTVTVKAYNNTWAQIILNGRTGYCKRASLERCETPQATVRPTETAKPDDGEIVHETFSARVTSGNARVFSSPSSSARYLGNAALSATVRVFAYNNNWAYIGLNGRYGYIEREHLMRLSEFAPTPTPTPTPTPAPTPTPTPTPKPTPTPSPTPRPVKKTQSEIFNGDYTNEEKIYYFLTDIAGYNTAVACGILANMKKECSFNPKAVSSSGNYHGLCQWYNTRFNTIIKFCETNGYEPYSLEGQLNFIMYDLKTLQPKYGRELSAIENTAQGAYDAGYYFCYNYERPSNKAVKSDERGTLARETYWEKYGY